MNQFSELVIETESLLVGDSIKIGKIFEKEIAVLDYQIRDSKFPEKGNGKCLWLQIEFNGEKRVTFTGSMLLQETIKKIDKSKFPFTTKIIRQDNYYKFT